MRLDNGGETVRWMTALQDATQKDQSFRDLLNDVPLLSLLSAGLVGGSRYQTRHPIPQAILPKNLCCRSREQSQERINTAKSHHGRARGSSRTAFAARVQAAKRWRKVPPALLRARYTMYKTPFGAGNTGKNSFEVSQLLGDYIMHNLITQLNNTSY